VANHRPTIHADAPAFDEDQRPEASIEPDWETIYGERDGGEREDGPVFSVPQARKMRQDAMRGLIRLIASGGVSASEAGRRLVMVNHLLDPDRGTQAELARQLGLTPGRVSQLLNAEREKMSLFYRVLKTFEGQ